MASVNTDGFFGQPVTFEVKDSDCNYAVIATASRIPREHRGWMSVTYRRRRYQLFGGIRNPYFINIRHPIARRAN